MVVHCNICRVECSTEQSLQCHLQGRKHQKVVSEFEERKQQARCSVFVRGFPQHVKEDDIKKYFSRFGDIVEVIIEDKKDLYAFVEFSAVDAKNKAVRQKQHYIDNHRVVVKPRTFKESNFRRYRYNPQIKKGPKGDKSNETNEKDDPISRSDVTLALSGAVTVLDQMQRLCERIRMTDEEIEMKRQLCLMLQSVLAPYFPGCSVHQFGSSVNGFGVRGCDADIFLNIRPNEEQIQDLEHREQVKLPYIRDIRSLKKNYGPLTSADLEPMSSYDKVRLVSRLLCEHAPGCNNIIAIPSARCPVIRFVHEPTNIKCDITINNRIALKNSQLLRLYSCLDDRVRLLVYTIRYWAKLKEVAGSGTKLSNYALTFTVIYFLQNTTPPVLPTVEHLASMVEADSQDVINNWNCSFESDFKRLEPSSNPDSADELLRKYFQFYSAQDFSTTVFQLRTASAKSVLDFLSQYEMSGLKSPFKIGQISIQDPFVLEHNITGNVNNEKKTKISTEFTIATCKSSKWLPKLDDGCTGLVSLLSDDIPAEVLNKCNLPQGKKHTFQIVLKESHLLRKMSSSGKDTELGSRIDWCRRVIRFTRDVLSDVLCLSVEALTPTEEIGDKSKDVQMDSGTSEQTTQEHSLVEQSMKPGSKYSQSNEHDIVEIVKQSCVLSHRVEESLTRSTEEKGSENKDIPMVSGNSEQKIHKHSIVKDQSIKPGLESLTSTEEMRRENKDIRMVSGISEQTVREYSVVKEQSIEADVENSEDREREVDSVKGYCVLIHEARKRHSTNSSDDMEVKKCCFGELENSDGENTENTKLKSLPFVQDSINLEENKQGMVGESLSRCSQQQDDKIEDKKKFEELVKMETDLQCSDTENKTETPEKKTEDFGNLEQNVNMETESLRIDTENEIEKSQPEEKLKDKKKVEEEHLKIKTDCHYVGVENEDFVKLPPNEKTREVKEFQNEGHKKFEANMEMKNNSECKDVHNMQQNEKMQIIENLRQTGSQCSNSSILSSPILPPTNSPEESNSLSTKPVKYSAELGAMKAELLCKVHCHTWQGRNKIRKSELELGAAVDLNLERVVSQKILERNGKSKNLLLGFRCKFDPVATQSVCVVNVTIAATENQSECQAFVSFFKSFICRLVDRHLNAETLDNPASSCLKGTSGNSEPSCPIQISGNSESGYAVETSEISRPSCSNIR